MGVVVFDYLTIVFWTITYILVIVSGIRSRRIKKVAMPYCAGVLNFAWEICALQWSQGFWGYIVWFAIDFLIVFIGFAFLDSGWKRVGYILSVVFSTVGLYFIFRLSYGLAYSVYVIDLVMSICFLAERKRLSPKMKVPIAAAKLLGDFFAGFVFGRELFIVVVIAVLVFICNAAYLYLCIADCIRNARATE